MAPKYISKLQGKRVLVLGGTSGIGFCVAEAAVEHGATVIISSSRQAKIDNTIQRLTSSYPEAKNRISGYACDLADAQAVESNIVTLYKSATNDGKDKLDHVVTTAGDMHVIPAFDELKVEDIGKALQVRWIGTIMLGKHAKHYMNDNAASSFTSTGGVNTYKPQRGWVLQAGCGGGNEGTIRALAVQLAPIRANLVAPGAVITELWGAIPEEQMNKIKDNYSQKMLVGQLGSPEDVAEAYIYLMKDKFVTGQVILTDGGSVLT